MSMLKENKIQSTNEGSLAQMYEDIFRHQKHRHQVSAFIEKYTPEILKEVDVLLKGEKLSSFTIGDNGCYDAEIHENGNAFFVEATLDADDNLEDCHCSCNTGLCLHVAAILWLIDEQSCR